VRLWRGTRVDDALAMAAILAGAMMIWRCAAPPLPKAAGPNDLRGEVIDTLIQHEMNGTPHYQVKVEYRDQTGALVHQWEEIGWSQWDSFGRVGASICVDRATGNISACD
jgi:hypothetical protein